MNTSDRSPATLVLLVRHGQASVPDQEGRYRSLGDIPLTPVGIAQAQRAGELMRSVRLDDIWASDLRRARETATIIADACEMPVQQDMRLRELVAGDLDGSTPEEVERDNPQFLPWIQSGFHQGFPGPGNYVPADLQFPGGESIVEAGARVTARYQELIRQYAGGCLAMVTHAWVTSAILCHVLKLPTTEYYRLGIANAGVSLVRVDAEGHGVLEALNLSVPLDALAGGSLAGRTRDITTGRTR